MKRIKQENKHVVRGAEVLSVSLVIWSAIDYYMGGKLGLLIWSIIASIVSIISIEIILHHEKWSEARWVRYFSCCLTGVAFAGVFLLLNFL